MHNIGISTLLLSSFNVFSPFLPPPPPSLSAHLALLSLGFGTGNTTVQSDRAQRGDRTVRRAARLPHPVHLDTRNNRRGHRSQRKASSSSACQIRLDAYHLSGDAVPCLPGGGDRLAFPAAVYATAVPAPVRSGSVQSCARLGNVMLVPNYRSHVRAEDLFTSKQQSISPCQRRLHC